MNPIGPAFASFEGEDILNWSLMFPGYFETLARGRIIATDTTVLVCDKWLNAGDEERKALFYGAGLFHLCRVAAFEIPGETGENTLHEIDKMEDWPAEPLVAKAKSAIDLRNRWRRLQVSVHDQGRGLGEQELSLSGNEGAAQRSKLAEVPRGETEAPGDVCLPALPPRDRDRWNECRVHVKNGQICLCALS